MIDEDARKEAGTLSRRAMLASMGAVFAGSGTASAASSTDLNADEQANVEHVRSYLKAWSEQAPDQAARLASFMAEPCSLSFVPEHPEPLTNRAALVAQFGRATVNGPPARFQIIDTIARGASVLMSLDLYLLKEGRDVGNPIPAVGLFVLEAGCIKHGLHYTFFKLPT